MGNRKLIILALALALVSVLAVGTFVTDDVSAEETENTTGACTWAVEDKKLTITGNGAMGDYSKETAAPWGTAITEVIIGSGVTSIGAYAFADCADLVSVEIPGSVQSISQKAFANCPSLTDIKMNEGLKALWQGVFENCTSLTTVVLPASVTALYENNQFAGCTSLAAITVSESNEVYYSVDGVLFSHNSDGDHLVLYPLAKSGAYDIPQGIAVIDTNAFANCTSLTSITVPDSVTVIGSNAFKGCTNLKYAAFGSSISDIQSDAFGSVVFYDTDGSTVIQPTPAALKSTFFKETGGKLVKQETCTVSFDPNGDTFKNAPGSIIVLKGDELSVKDLSTDFRNSVLSKRTVGWAATQAGEAVETITVTSDTVLYAVWGDNTHTVTYMVGDEVVGEVETYQYNTLVTLRGAYEKEGYTVGKWNADVNDFGSTFLMPDKDVVITATCTVNQYKVTYMVGSREIADYSGVFDYSTDVALKARYERTGYTVTDWAIPEGLTLVAGKFSMPAHDVTFTASESINSYTVTYKVDGEIIGDVETYKYNVEVTVRAQYQGKVGYTVSAWSCADVTAGQGFFNMPAKNIEITATSKVNSYNVFYYVGEDKISEYCIEANYNSTVAVSPVYVKDGYTVTAWTTEDVAVNGGSFTMPAHDVTFRATATAKEYTVTYKVDGETVGEVEKYTYRDPVTVRAPFIKTGYTVTEWNSFAVDESGVKSEHDLNNGVFLIKSDVEIYATSTINQYKVIYLVDGAEVFVDSFDYNTKVVVRQTYFKEGCDVSAWRSDDVVIDNGQFVLPANDVRINADSTPKTYTVYYKVDNEDIAKETYRFGDVVTVRDPYTKVGYTVSQWTSTDVTIVDGKFTIPAGDVFIRAVSTVNQYTITFDTNGGSEVPAIVQDYNTVIVMPAEPTRSGFKFIGWTPAIPATMPAEDMTVKAEWAVAAMVDAEGNGTIDRKNAGAFYLPANAKNLTVDLGNNMKVGVADVSDLVGKTVKVYITIVDDETTQEGYAYDFVFVADGTAHHGKMNVTLPYSKLDGKHPVVYHVDGDNRTEMNVVEYGDGYVVFETDHNSRYLVLSAENHESGGISMAVVAAVVVILLLVLLFVLTYLGKIDLGKLKGLTVKRS